MKAKAKEIVFNRALERALQDEKLVPVTQPEVKDESFSEKDGSTFIATFVKRPEVKLVDTRTRIAKACRTSCNRWLTLPMAPAQAAG